MPKKPEEFTASERLLVKTLLLPWKLRTGSVVLAPLALRAGLFSELQISTAAFVQEYGVDPIRVVGTILGSGGILLVTLFAESLIKDRALFTDHTGLTFAKGIILILAVTYLVEKAAQVSEPALRCLIIPAVIFYMTSFAVSRSYPEE